MFGYYLNLALRSLKRNRGLTVLMVLTIAIGIGASMTTLAVYRVLAKDPIPDRSSQLFRVQLDSASRQSKGDEPPDDMTRLDAEDLLAQRRAKRQAITNGGDSTIELPGTGKPMRIPTRHATADFFPMFDVPVIAGRSWTAAEDEQHARVVLINRELAEKLFGGASAVGRTLQLAEHPVQIIGVVGDFNPQPKYFDLANRFGDPDQLYVPFQTARELDLGISANMNCNKGTKEGQKPTDRSVDCTWLQYWVELPSGVERTDYLNYLQSYSQQQVAAGRFERKPNARLRNVLQWMDYQKAVPTDVRLQMWLALGFLIVCMTNVVGLLLAKFLRRSGEIGVRRALGAGRADILRQFLIEAGVVGVAGGLGGVLLTILGLAAVRHQPVDYASLARIDPHILLITLCAAVITTIIAGLFSAWRAMRITPSIQLKSL